MSKSSYDETGLIKIYYAQISKIPLLSKEETANLIIKAQNGDQTALKKVVESNLRLVLKIAQNIRNTVLSFTDLVAEGNFGLYDAVRKFDVTRDLRFSTFAAFQIRNRMKIAMLSQGGTVHVPSDIQKKYFQIKSIENRLMQKYHCDKVDASLIAKHSSYTVSEIREILLAKLESVSPVNYRELNNSNKEIDNDQFIEIVIDNEENLLEQNQEDRELIKTVELWFKKLQRDQQEKLLESIAEYQDEHLDGGIALYSKSLHFYTQGLLLHDLRNFLFNHAPELLR